MGDGTEIVVEEQKKLVEELDKELVGSDDEVRDSGEEVNNDNRGVKDLKVNDTGDGEKHDDKEEAGAETESSLDMVKSTEKATSDALTLVNEDVNLENGITHSIPEYGIIALENKQLLTQVISVSARLEETRNNGIDLPEIVGIELEVEQGERIKNNISESGAQRNGETGADYISIKKATGDKSLIHSIEVAQESSSEDKGETQGHSRSFSPGVTFSEHETVQNGNGPPEIEERESEVVTSATPPPARPTGLGRAAPLLEPTPRVHQQSPPVNTIVSNTQPQKAEDSTTTTETDEHDETREKLQLIRVKFLRLAHRLGQTPHNVVVAQVLYRLGLAEQIRSRNGSRVGAFSFDRASATAEQLETSGQESLNFACTIMILGKTGIGKSATINSIFNEIKISTDPFQIGTRKVQPIEGFVQGIKVRVIDTPGLLASYSDQIKNEKILKSVKAFIKKNPPDIVLYLDRLDMQSRNSNDMPLLRTITDVFGPSIWFNAIVGLTHAVSAPPDGTSYDMFVAQRSHVIQQAIRQAAGDMRLMNPVSLVENHSGCRTNRAGQRVLPNGQVWKPHLLLLSFASKILAEANALLKLQDNIPVRPLTPRSKSQPLPFLLSSLLQSKPQAKLPDDEEEEEESSDSDDELEYDELPPFELLTRTEFTKLSKHQKKLYLDEIDYREKLLMKKQMKEERKRRKLFKKFAAEIKDDREIVEEPASVPVPIPDLSLPSSFDSDNPTHRYRYLDSSTNQWLVRPVLDAHGWDHDVGYEGVNAERLFVVNEKIPISFSGQVTKDKKDATVQMEIASSVKHGENKSTSLGFDMQNVGKELAYTVRTETKFNNFKRNKAAAGLSLTVLGDSVSAGVKVEDKLIANKRFRMVMSGGAMTNRGDVAYGSTLEAQLRDKDYPLGRFLSTFGLSFMDWHGDLAIGGNVQSQVPIGRSTNLIARANLNNRGVGQVSVRVNSSEQLQLAMFAIVPLFKKLRSLYSNRDIEYGQY